MRKLLGTVAFLLLGCATSDPINAADSSGVGGSLPVCQDGVEPEAGRLDGSFPPDNTVHMRYHGGQVMINPINIYLLWYGDWSQSQAPSLMEDMITNLSASPWYQINSFYYEQIETSHPGLASTKKTYYVNSHVNLIQSIDVGYSHGNYLADEDISMIVKENIDSNKLPLDSDGQYFVLISKDVGEGLFCLAYCGWHDSQVMNEKDIKFALVGDTGACPNECSLETQYLQSGINHSPNDDWGIDGMASVILHELSEAATDPDPVSKPAWKDDWGYENADRCAWTYGQPYYTENCSIANVKIGNHDFMIQQNWVLDANGGHCGLSRE